MKKFLILLLLSLLAIITGCYQIISVKYNEMYDLVKNASIENYLLNDGPLDLIYDSTTASDNAEYGRNYLSGNLLLHNDYYIINFVNEDLFLFNKESKMVYYFQEEIIELKVVNNLKAFIHLVEEEKDLKFRLLDYLGFEVLHELLDEKHSDKMKFTKRRGSMNPYIRYIDMDKKHLSSFPLLEEVYQDLTNYGTNNNPENKDITINFSVSSSRISRINMGSFASSMVSFQTPEGYFERINEIIELI